MYEIREIFNFSAVDDLYKRSGIKRPEDCDDTIGIYSDGKLVGTASIRGNILMGFAVSEEAQGEGLAGILCTELIKIGMENGYSTFYIFTKPEKAFLFEACGFKKIVTAPSYASLLEWGNFTIQDFIAKLRNIASDKPSGGAVIVMNANPFTLGHKYLIERASAENPWVYVLVVEEDRSIFPHRVRLDLVKRGAEEFKNVTVFSGGSYVISQLTFPSYFTKDAEVATAQSEIDLRLFGQYIAPALGIKKRYVGIEPYCNTTDQYNTNMHRILPGYNIEIVEIDRLQNEAGFISATKVREYLRQGNTEALRTTLLETTFEFFDTEEGQKIIQVLKQKP